MIQQIQQKRELQRLQMAGGSQLPMASLLAGSSTPLLSAGTPGLLPTASAPPLLPAGALVAPSLGNNTSLMAAAAAAAAVAAAGGPPVLTAQTNPFLSLSGADGSGSGPKGGVSKGSGLGEGPGVGQRDRAVSLLLDGQRGSIRRYIIRCVIRRRKEATPRAAECPALDPRASASTRVPSCRSKKDTLCTWANSERTN